MKRTLQAALLASSLAFGSAAFAQSDTGAEKQSDKAAAKMKQPKMLESTAKKDMKDMKGMTMHNGVMVPTDAKAFMERLHFVNQLEIQLGNLAQQNSQNADVKSYGQQMVQMHTQADQELQTYAQSKGVKLADMPKPMNDVEKNDMAAHAASTKFLQSVQGPVFDSKYLSSQVADHDMTIGKVMAAQATMKSADAQMTQMLTKLSQELPKHREMAFNALGKLPQQMKSGTGGSGSDMGDTSGTGGSGSSDMSDTSDTGGSGASDSQ
jgi:putative membrane protein